MQAALFFYRYPQWLRKTHCLLFKYRQHSVKVSPDFLDRRL